MCLPALGNPSLPLHVTAAFARGNKMQVRACDLAICGTCVHYFLGPVARTTTACCGQRVHCFGCRVQEVKGRVAGVRAAGGSCRVWEV